MTRIIAGMFDHVDAAAPAIEALTAARFEESDYQIFHVNAPGQHDAYPGGGDEYADEGSRNSGVGAAVGAVAGAAVGAGVGTALAAAIGTAVAGPVGTIAGLGVGAYVGSLGGALAASEDADDSRIEHPARPDAASRRAGAMLAIAVHVNGDRELAISILRVAGAVDIEEADGQWRDRDWVDFDATCAPRLVSAADGRDAAALAR